MRIQNPIHHVKPIEKVRALFLSFLPGAPRIRPPSTPRAGARFWSGCRNQFRARRCPECGGKLRLIALVKKEETIQAHLETMHLLTQPTGPPEGAKPEPAETEPLELEWSGEGESADRPEYPD
jgi:hypothetical protein